VLSCLFLLTFIGPELACARDGARPTPLAVLGDSDSHSYHDVVYLSKASARGGEFRSVTWQWTEVLSRLRGRSIDQGEWGTWGTPIKVAEFLDWLGLGGRAPRKQDYRFNFAVSGAKCSDLMTGYYRQAPRLLSLMDRDPELWQSGVVSIRIGVNSIGMEPQLTRYAKEGATSAVREEVSRCVAWIQQSVDLLRHRHPQLKFVLVGILDNSDWPPLHDRWRSAREHRNITAVLDLFDDALRSMAAKEPGIAFFDDRAWFRKNWGDHGPNGEPHYRTVNLGGRTSVANTQGDRPENAVVADGHAGSVWNALWVRDYVALLNASFGMSIPSVTTEEIAKFVDPEGSFGLRRAGD
jgi:hypothetical protein